tara:strand:- start:55 stop:705 length:651 start_codon:yes stop_codon:yes gene_type:complete
MNVEYRPFLVKEEKMLLVAQESKNQKEMLRAMKKLVDVCLFKKVDVDKLALFDLEYIFIKLRSKSVGETTTILAPCGKCEESTEITINLDEIKIKYPKNAVDTVVKFTDDVGVNLRYIGVKDLDRISGEDSKQIDESFAMVRAAIESIFDADNVYPAIDQTPRELDAFVDSLSHQQIQKITDFIDQSPKLTDKIQFTCTACKHVNKNTLEGSDAFF